MNMAERIQALRKTKGVSQEGLANLVGVSRQAVSKWESEQSIPDIEKIIKMSEYFEVTTDYILKGVEPDVESNGKKSSELTSKILYIASTAFIAIGLFCAFGGWYEEQTMESIWGSMIIQAIGVAGLFIGRQISDIRPSFAVNWLDLIGVLFMPCSMLAGILANAVFYQGWISPYPVDAWQIVMFVILYSLLCAISFLVLRRKGK